MNSVMTLALVVIFPVACLLALMGLSWLEDSLMRGIEADAEAAKQAAKQAVFEMPVRRPEPSAEPVPVSIAVPQQRLQPSRAAS